MSLSYRARVLGATYKGVPAEDVLRLAHPAQYLRAPKYASDAYSPQAATDGLEFVNVSPLKSPSAARPAAAWRRRTHRDQEGAEMLPDRATGMLQEIARVVEDARSD